MIRPARSAIVCGLLLLGSATGAPAQSLPSFGGNSVGGMMSNLGNGGGGGSLGGGLGGMLGRGLPSVSSAPTGNVAGVLGYCVQNNALQGGSATSTLGTLTSRPGLTASPGYAQGQQGLLQTGNGNSVSMAGMNGQVRSRMCGMVLNRAKSFL